MTFGQGGERRAALAGLRLRPIRAAVAFALMGATLVAVVLGLSAGAGPVAPTGASTPAGSFTDVRLHREEVAFAREPGTYYRHVIDEQRRRGYPLRPFVGVRPPVLAFALAWLPGGQATARLLIGALAAGVSAAWTIKLVDPLGVTGAAVGGLALATGVVAAFTPNGYLMHECWAGLLIALSLALYPGQAPRGRPGLLAASLLAGLAAALVRELALPYLGVMAVMALVERRPKEALLWTGAIGLCLLALAAHAMAVLRLTLPTDRGMQWVQVGGWPFLVSANRWNAAAATAPWLLAVLLPTALAGILAWAGPVGGRLGLVVLGYATGLLVVGRPEDTYWGLMIAPLLPLGWVGAAAVTIGIARRAESAPV